MTDSAAEPIAQRIRNAWIGRISGCMLGKPVELLSMMSGRDELAAYLARAGRDARLSHRGEGVIGPQAVAAIGAAIPRPVAIHEAYDGMSPVHTVNNLALVVWGLLRAATTSPWRLVTRLPPVGTPTATVGALWGLTGRPIPGHWAAPWNGRVRTTLAGVGELGLDDFVARTVAVCVMAMEAPLGHR